MFAHIDDSYDFGWVAHPKKWVPVRRKYVKLITNKKPIKCVWNRAPKDQKNALADLVSKVNLSPYNRVSLDTWDQDKNGDCISKCIYTLLRMPFLESARIALCKVGGVDHAVILFYRIDGTYVLDPTNTNKMIDWRLYPAKWLCKYSHGNVWQNFRPTNWTRRKFIKLAASTIVGG